MTLKNHLTSIIVLFILICISFNSKAQNKIYGIVTDSITYDPIPFVSIYLKGSTIGTMTDNSGKFSISIPNSAHQLYAHSVGYKEKSIVVTNGYSNVRIQLSPTTYRISEVIVKPKKTKYSKKGNPAVDFLKKIIDSKDKFNPLNKDFYQYQQDRKIKLAINSFRKPKSINSIRKYGFLKNYVDTSNLTGKPFLPISSKEIVENYYYRKTPRSEKRLLIGRRSFGVDEMLSDDGVDQFLGEVFKDVDIYDNNITMFLKPFVSPLSVGAANFYKYFLMDTVVIGGLRCADLSFVPFSSQSTGFTGHLYVTLDSTYFVKKIKLNFPKDINLNYIQDMSIEQEFNRAPDGTRLLMNDDMEVEFSITRKTKSLYARRTSSYANHSFDSPREQSVFNEKANVIIANDATSKPDSFWVNIQKDSIDLKGKSVENMLARLRKDPLYYYSEKLFSALLTGYIETSEVNNKISLGPIYNTISTNTVEGIRLRLSALTTANLNEHWFGTGFIAYGTKDKKMKYQAQLEYSFNKKLKQSNEFPIHSLKLSYSYDINQVGQHYSTQSDNIYLSLKRQPDDKITYQRILELNYNKEYYSQFSYGIDCRYRTEYATPYLPFIDFNTQNAVSFYTLSEARFRIRYAPGEKFYQTPGKRHSITRTAPIFTLSQTVALKGVLGSSYDYSHTEFGFQKRFWFSAYGNSNVIIRAGKVWTSVPFPLLIIPNANLSYTIQYDTYAMMNALEFINDQYVSWDLNYNMNGLILNRIPLIQILKLREILSFRGLYGNLNRRNDPSMSKDLFEFPQSSYSMGKVPYMEAGVGVENILNFIRIDYVWRLSYLDHPNIDKSGIRVSLDFAF